MSETRLETVQQLSSYVPALHALGYRSVEQFIATATVASRDLARYLKIDPAALQSLIAQLAPTGGAARASLRKRHPLGVRLERIPRPQTSLMRAPGIVATLPSTKNLIADMQPIKDQGDRGTCVAHASGAVGEHYWRGQGQVIDLSRQFLYWDCKQHDGDPTHEGTWVAVAMARLLADGCCLEATWPYVPTIIEGNESQDPPPAGAVDAAAPYKTIAATQIASTSVPDIKSALAGGFPVAFSIPVFNSWYQNDEVYRTGELVNPLPGEPNVGGHAMCLVGYMDDDATLGIGGGRFYLRNSWGTAWANQSVLGTPGYGTIPYSYIAANCTEAFTLE
jgi:C1A family cysteine protease